MSLELQKEMEAIFKDEPEHPFAKLADQIKNHPFAPPAMKAKAKLYSRCYICEKINGPHLGRSYYICEGCSQRFMKKGK